MGSSSFSDIRDASMCLFSFCFNGSRESSVCSLKSDSVELTSPSITRRLCVLKGRSASK